MCRERACAFRACQRELSAALLLTFPERRRRAPKVGVSAVSFCEFVLAPNTEPERRTLSSSPVTHTDARRIFVRTARPNVPVPDTVLLAVSSRKNAVIGVDVFGVEVFGEEVLGAVAARASRATLRRLFLQGRRRG